MAKVMISIPDQLLDRIDACARSSGESRSGFLQRLAEREVSAAAARRQEHLEELLAKAMFPPGSLGGDAAQLIREDRESH